jgi:hypothetical protein
LVGGGGGKKYEVGDRREEVRVVVKRYKCRLRVRRKVVRKSIRGGDLVKIDTLKVGGHEGSTTRINRT